MKTLFIAPVGQSVGLSTTALGVVRSLQRQGLKVGFCKPIAQEHIEEGVLDRSVHFAKQSCGIDAPIPVTLERAEELLGQNQLDSLMEEVVGVCHQAAMGVDVLVVEGLALTTHNAYAHQLNTTLARDLDADTLLVSSLRKVKLADLADQIEIAMRDFASTSRPHAVGVILNHGNEQTNVSLVRQSLQRGRLRQLTILGVVAYHAALLYPRTLDVARHLSANLLNEGAISNRRVQTNFMVARSVEHIADQLRTGILVITPGDRQDIIMAASLASMNGVPLAGLLLTCGYLPDESIRRLCRPALSADLPVMLVHENSYETAAKLSQMDTQVPLDDIERMEKVLEFIADSIDPAPIMQRLEAPAELRLSPPAFRYELIQKARAAHKRIVLPEGDEPRTVQAAVICHQKGIAHCILLANPAKVHAVAEALGLTLPADIQILDPEQVRARYIAPMVEARKHKGLSAPMAEKQLEDTVVLGTMMLALDEVDGLVSGAIHTTANTVRPALQLIKTAPSAQLVSSVFFMLMPEQVLVYGDCAINPDPSAEELADIAIQSADSARAFGIVPRVAMISYSTGSSGEGSDVEKVRQATLIAQQKRPDIMIDGPLQYDAASVMSVGQQKAPNSQVAGKATVFVFPDLNTGNTTYKAVQRSANVVSVGPMLQGLRKPVNDLSRGALVDDIVYTIALTAIQATQS